MVASGMGWLVESKQIRPINVIKSSQKFIGFNHVTTLSSMVQRINFKFSKSCFIWQVCQAGKSLVAHLCTFSRVSISFAKYGHQSWIEYSRCGLTYILCKKLNSSLEILTNVLLSIICIDWYTGHAFTGTLIIIIITLLKSDQKIEHLHII